MNDAQSLRTRFPTLAEKVYLNSGSYGLLSVDVREAYRAYLDDRILNGANWGGWLGRYEAVRTSIARLLGVKDHEIAVNPSASAGINALASALDFSGKRNKVVVSNFEFPTSGQIWHAQGLRGAQIEHVPENAEGYIPPEHFEALIDERTAVVALSHVCYRNGAKLDVEKIVQIARRHGALVILDCFQTVGTEAIDLKALGVDFAVGGVMKYLLGSAGTGFLYVREDLIAGLTPTTTGWFAQADIDAMDIFANEPAPTARRFETGTPSIPCCYAAEAGLKIIHEFGADAIGARVRALSGRCIDALQNAGWRVATPRRDDQRGPMVAIRSSDDQALVARLAEAGIVTSCRDGNVRAGFHFYNCEEDVDRLLSALQQNRDLKA